MSARPNLTVINSDTGELVQDDRDLLIEQLTRDLHGKQIAIAKLRKEVSELRLVEPEGIVIQDVLEYTRERIGKPRQHITPGGERWEKCRARLRDRLDDRGPWTPAELKLAADGALLDPWLSGQSPKAPKDGRYLDAKTIYKSSEQVERLRDLALGFVGQAGVHLRDLIDVAHELRIVSWKHLLRICECGHRRIEHARGHPSLNGQEMCFECECQDFFEDVFTRLEQTA